MLFLHLIFKHMLMSIFKPIIICLSFTILLGSCKQVKEDYYPNGRLKSKTTYRFGKEHGESIIYNENYGAPSFIIQMKNGKKHGKMTRYFFNGNIETEAYYKDDIQEGIETIYDLNGFPIVQTTYLHGMKNGPYTTWHAKDMIREQGAFAEDMFDGEWIYYDERGLMVGEAVFNKGTGQQIAYDHNGNLYRVTSYVNNMKNGKEVYFTPTGDTARVNIYTDDRIENVYYAGTSDHE